MAGKFGEKLRRERESRGITLDQIAEATKISSRNLRALEEENFATLPGGIFNKGFVRSYARFLGINEEKAVADYLAAAGEKLSPEKIEGGQIPDPPPKPKKPEVRDKSTGTSPGFWAVACVLLLIALALGGRKYYSQYHAERDARAARATKPEPPLLTSSTAVPASVTTDPAVAAEIPAPTSPELQSALQTSAPEPRAIPLFVQVHANSDAWMQMTIDGSVTEAMLMAGSDRSYRGIREIKLVTGNAGGIDVSFNGKKVGLLGPEGVRREITFTPNN